MKVLAIDTSTSCGVVGLSVDGQPIGEVSMVSNEAHSARLLPSIDWLLKTCGFTLQDVDGFGVTLGPGSFTGLRIGLSTVKGFAWSTRKPVVGLRSLDILARQCPMTEVSILPMLDARRSEVYGGIYRWKNHLLETVVEPVDRSVESFLKDLDGPAIVLGEGARRYRGQIETLAKGRVQFLSEEFDVPHGATLAKMAHDALARGETLDIEKAEPMYLRHNLTDPVLGKGFAR
jgi:tRNA threonylcarbamoyladenosine biosynthesis protein TsaB